MYELVQLQMRLWAIGLSVWLPPPRNGTVIVVDFQRRCRVTEPRRLEHDE